MSSDGGQYVARGISVGFALAMIISWDLNRSILWALLHGVGGWLYVGYYYFWLMR